MKLFQVDAFTPRPFAGNPAGVCLLDSERPDDWMQSVAAEMNLAETAFLVPSGDAFRLRWFTPTTEVPLCGHATLASSHVLWESGILAPDATASFDTRSGRLTARRVAGRIEIDLPAAPVTQAAPPAGALEALGVTPTWSGRTGDRGLGDVDYLIELASEEIVRGLKPDFGRLRTQKSGFIVTARAKTAPFDFVSRYFAAFVGIDEDPVTGAAHCALVPYWSAKLAKKELTAYQASPRGGIVHGVDSGARVQLSGEAVTVFRAELLA
jgi:PhzF family phenazine biosynthesis protein